MEVVHKRALSRFSRLAFSKKCSRAKSINFAGNIEKNTSYRTLFRARGPISLYGAPPNFKVNTPLKSHQLKIESLTMARGLFYIQSNNGHRHYARCVHTSYVNRDENMDGDTTDGDHEDGSRGAEERNRLTRSVETQVGTGRKQNV